MHTQKIVLHHFFQYLLLGYIQANFLSLSLLVNHVSISMHAL